jgi:hypothetical protein
MAKFIRYALATVCFAASVGCLALWWRSVQSPYSTDIVCTYPQVGGICSLDRGRLSARYYWMPPQSPGLGPARRFEVSTYYVGGAFAKLAGNIIDASAFEKHGSFGCMFNAIYCPLWYPALIFALAGIAPLRFGRRFTIRSAIIATTVVAGLLGMAVGL